NPSTEYADKLISRIGQTPSWIAKRIGVTDKRIRYILMVKGPSRAKPRRFR
ncbi:hypothetical protein ALP45_05190, partial [Pseudomonas coronafaciens pv. atropurpurea]